MSSKTHLFAQTLMQNAVGATANGTVLNCDGMTDAVVQLSGTFSATVTWEANVDGTNWIAVLATPLTTGTAATTATAVGLYRVNVTSLHELRARVSGFSSGNVTAIGRATAA